MHQSLNNTNLIARRTVPVSKPPLPPIKSATSPLSRLCLQENIVLQPTQNIENQHVQPISNKQPKSKETEESHSDSSSSDRERSRSRSRDKRKTKKNEKRRRSKRRINDNNKNNRDQIQPAQKLKSISNHPIYEQTSSQLATKNAQTEGPLQQKILEAKQSYQPILEQKKSKVKNQKQSPSIDRFYKTRICPQYKNGNCQKGQKCSFAHGDKELRSQPNPTFKTKICYSFQKGVCTKAKEECNYAHGREDLRPTPGKQTQSFLNRKDKTDNKNNCLSEENNRRQNENEVFTKEMQQQYLYNKNIRALQEKPKVNDRQEKYGPYGQSKFNSSGFNQNYEYFMNGVNKPNNFAYKPLMQHPVYGSNQYFGNNPHHLHPQQAQFQMYFNEGYGNYYYPMYGLYQPQPSANSLNLYPTFSAYSQDANFAFSNNKNFDYLNNNNNKPLDKSNVFENNLINGNCQKKKEKPYNDTFSPSNN